ncbi:hypothetical protein [Marinobacter sp.]|uniref:hypothetical protein n=1 Tax=Marinobacter sp. TaxID=50741 RepID=UPI00356746AC
MNWSVVKKFSGAALSLIGLAVVADVIIVALFERGAVTAEYAGCYLTDAMVVGYECQGFWPADIISAWLNLPLWSVYGLLFAPYSLKAALLAVLVWSPLVIYVMASRKVAQHA